MLSPSPSSARSARRGEDRTAAGCGCVGSVLRPDGSPRAQPHFEAPVVALRGPSAAQGDVPGDRPATRLEGIELRPRHHRAQDEAVWELNLDGSRFPWRERIAEKDSRLAPPRVAETARHRQQAHAAHEPVSEGPSAGDEYAERGPVRPSGPRGRLRRIQRRSRHVSGSRAYAMCARRAQGRSSPDGLASRYPREDARVRARRRDG